jgi:hypothetical protein
MAQSHGRRGRFGSGRGAALDPHRIAGADDIPPGTPDSLAAALRAEAQTRRPAAPRAPWIALAALGTFAVVLATGADRLWRARRVEIITLPTTPSGLQLDAAFGRGGLVVTWSRESPLVREARAAVLSIEGSGRPAMVELDSLQLRRGSFHVDSVGPGEVGVRLHVVGTRREAMESLRLGTAGALPRGGVSDPALESGAADLLSASAEVAARLDALRSAAAADLRRARSERRRRAPRPQPEASGSDPDATAPAEAAEVKERARRSALAEVRGEPTAQAPEGLVEPKPVHRVLPEIPDHLKDRVTADLRIPIRVYIDATGQVTGTSSLSTEPVAHRLSVPAIEAARQWRFEPARVEGRNVPSETIVEFFFRRPE